MSFASLEVNDSLAVRSCAVAPGWPLVENVFLISTHVSLAAFASKVNPSGVETTPVTVLLGDDVPLVVRESPSSVITTSLFDSGVPRVDTYLRLPLVVVSYTYPRLSALALVMCNSLSCGLPPYVLHTLVVP